MFGGPQKKIFSFLPLSADFRPIFGWNVFLLLKNVEFFKFLNFWNKNILAYFCPKKLIPGAKKIILFEFRGQRI